MPPARFIQLSKNIPPVEFQDSIWTGSNLLIVCCFSFVPTFPSVACFRCRRRPLYRREREKVFGQNTLRRRKILPENFFPFNEVCTNFHGRRGSGRPRNGSPIVNMCRSHFFLPSAYPYPRRFCHR